MFCISHSHYCNVQKMSQHPPKDFLADNFSMHLKQCRGTTTIISA